MEGLHFKYDNASDFDVALDDIFSIFSEETDDFELMQAQQIYHRLSTQEQSMLLKKSTFNHAPKVMKNDIRRYFSRMFMNTLNSGDFGKLQDYFNTFMMAPTKFIADHNAIDGRFCIPKKLETSGPRLMAHYLLGTFVMYPDMVVRMSASRITTSNSWAGTKVEMDVEVLATKMYDLSVDEWLPQLATLEQKYQLILDEKRRQQLAKQQAKTKNAPPTASEATNESEPVHVVPMEDADSLSSSEQCIVSNEDLTDTNTTAGSSKRKVSDLDTTDTESDTLTTHDVTQPQILLQPHIPEEYVHALCARATLLPEPVQLHMQGTILMFLDENNHIQHMNMTMTQK